MATSKIGKYDLDDNLKNELEEIKKSVSDGKTLVANAITDKGISTATDATFATMATNIESIRDLGNLNEMGAYTDSPICGTFISDATKGPYITAAVPKGVYRTSGGEFTNYPTLKIYRNDFASTIGLDAEKIMQGKYIAQIAGTATSDATANASHIVKDKIAYVKGAKVIGTMPVKAAATYTPKTTNQTIAAGQYLTGVQTIKGDANLKAANIAAGVSIFGITGTLPNLSNIFTRTFTLNKSNSFNVNGTDPTFPARTETLTATSSIKAAVITVNNGYSSSSSVDSYVYIPDVQLGFEIHTPSESNALVPSKTSFSLTNYNGWTNYSNGSHTSYIHTFKFGTSSNTFVVGRYNHSISISEKVCTFNIGQIDSWVINDSGVWIKVYIMLYS